MFKRIFAVAILGAALAACGGKVHAAAPTSVNNTAGTATYGTELASSVEKDTAAGYNRTKVKYPSGFQYVTDDAAWSRYAAIKAGLTKPVDVPTSQVGLSYDVAKLIIGCSNNSTYVVSFTGQPEYIADNCAFANAVKAASQ